MIRPFNILKDNQFFWTVGAENEKEGLLKTRKLFSHYDPEVFTAVEKTICDGCDCTILDENLTNDYYGYWLCEECNESYNDKTGYCSLSCCLGYGCDDSC